MLVVGCSAAPGSASKHCAGNFLACKLAGCNDLCQDRIIPKASHSGAGVSTHYSKELSNQMATVSHSRRAKSGTTGKSSVLFCSLLWGPLSSAKEQKLGTWKEKAEQCTPATSTDAADFQFPIEPQHPKPREHDQAPSDVRCCPANCEAGTPEAGKRRSPFSVTHQLALNSHGFRVRLHPPVPAPAVRPDLAPSRGRDTGGSSVHLSLRLRLPPCLPPASQQPTRRPLHPPVSKHHPLTRHQLRRASVGPARPGKARALQPAVARLPATEEEPPATLRRRAVGGRVPDAAADRVPGDDGAEGDAGVLVLAQPVDSRGHHSRTSFSLLPPSYPPP